MVIGLDTFVNDMKMHASSVRQMGDIATSAHDMLVRLVQNVDSILEILDIQGHSIAHAAVLRAKYSVTTGGDFEALYLQTQHFFFNCNPEHIRSIPHVYACVAHGFTKQLLSRGASIRGITVLLQAIKKMTDEPGQLTSIHADLCQLALAAKCFKPVLPVLNDNITDIIDEGGKFDAKDYLLYYYYGGMIYLAVKDLGRSIYFFELCLLIPAIATSKIMIEAYKKYILVSLLQSGKLVPVSKHASSTINQRVVRLNIAPYTELAHAYSSNIATDLHALTEKHREAFGRDKNYGLVKQCVAKQVKIKIQRLTKTFMTLSLADVASRVSLSTPKLAEQYILEMIECGEIFACISQKDGMVRFLDDPEKYNSAAMLKKLQDYMDRCMSLEQQVLRMTDQVVTSPAYVKKLVEQEAKSGKATGQL